MTSVCHNGLHDRDIVGRRSDGRCAPCYDASRARYLRSEKGRSTRNVFQKRYMRSYRAGWKAALRSAWKRRPSGAWVHL
jgi:hypothetical protein